MPKKETIKKEAVEESDKIEILEKYKSLKTDKKILICLYILIAISIAQLIIPLIFGTSGNYVSNSIKNNKSGKYDVSDFEEIKVDDLTSLSKDGETHVLFLGRSGCEYCIDFIPILKQAQEEYNYKTKYLNVDKITSNEDIDKLLIYDNKDGFIAKSFGSTPMVLIIKNNTLVNGWVGYSSYEEFEDFLNNSGIK